MDTMHKPAPHLDDQPEGSQFSKVRTAQARLLARCFQQACGRHLLPYPGSHYARYSPDRDLQSVNAEQKGYLGWRVFGVVV
jgi:hypothetical protein